MNLILKHPTLKYFLYSFNNFGEGNPSISASTRKGVAHMAKNLWKFIFRLDLLTLFPYIYILLLLYIIKVGPRHRNYAMWLHQITEILINF